MSRYAVIDFETTGMSPQNGDRALEIGVVLVEQGRVVDRFQSLMNPGRPVPFFITELTGISGAMVRHAPSPAQVMREVSRFVGEATLVAHNASFDRKFWQAEQALAGEPAAHDFLCTLLISRRLYPWAPNHRLQTLVELHGLPTDGRYHRALADANMTAALFIRMQNDLSRLYGEAPSPLMAEYQQMKRALVRSVPAL